MALPSYSNLKTQQTAWLESLDPHQPQLCETAVYQQRNSTGSWQKRLTAALRLTATSRGAGTLEEPLWLRLYMGEGHSGLSDCSSNLALTADSPLVAGAH